MAEDCLSKACKRASCLFNFPYRQRLFELAKQTTLDLIFFFTDKTNLANVSQLSKV